MIYVIIDECRFSGDGISNMLLSFFLLGVLYSFLFLLVQLVSLNNIIHINYY